MYSIRLNILSCPSLSVAAPVTSRNIGPQTGMVADPCAGTAGPAVIAPRTLMSGNCPRLAPALGDACCPAGELKDAGLEEQLKQVGSELAVVHRHLQNIERAV